MKPLFSYTDFRLFLKDWYNEQKTAGYSISYRSLAQQIGYNSPAHVTQLFNGKTRLSKEVADCLLPLLSLHKKESAYFLLLVQFNQTKGLTEKKQIYQEMIKYHKPGTTLLTHDQFAYYQKWYFAAIHDILSYFKFNGNFSELAKMVEPAITVREATAAVKLLERLEFIEKGDDGIFICHYPGISAYAEGRSVVLSSYAATMIDRAKYALEKTPENERLISWAGFSVSEATYQKIRLEAREFRKRLITLAQQDISPDRAYHLNLQLFPVAKKRSIPFDKEPPCD